VGLLYEIDDCVASVNRTIETYFKLPRTGLDVYDALSTPVQLNVVSFSTNPRRALPNKKGRAEKLKGLNVQTCEFEI
jgi:hypothetical protein